MIQPGYRDARPIYEQIKDGIRKMILSNAITENEKLPPVRQLALKLTVNPAVVERAYRSLEEDGYIYAVEKTGEYAVSADSGCRKQKLLDNFDCVVLELLGLSAAADELVMRVHTLADAADTAD